MYATVRHDGVWSTPTRLSAPVTSTARIYDGVSQTSIRVVANGNSFAVLWRDDSGVNLRIFDGSKSVGSQWDSTPRRVDGNKPDITSVGASLTTYKTGYALTWIQHAWSPLGSVRSVELATVLYGTWQQSSAEVIAADNVYGDERSEIAEGKDNTLLVAWSAYVDPGQSTSLTTRTWNNGVWSNPTAILTATPNYLSNLILQATTSGSFALYWRLNNGQLFAAMLPPGATNWTTSQLLSARSYEFASTGGATGHTVAWFSSGALQAAKSQSTEWQALAPVKQNWQTFYPSGSQPRMIEVGASVLYAWNASDYRNNTLGLGKLINGVWTEAFAIGDFGVGPIQRRDPSLARFGNGAAMAWVQYDRDTDASVADIVVQPALF